MVGVFGRSVSFTNKNSTFPLKKPTRHVRSASLPCSLKSHPIIQDIKDDIYSLRVEFGSSQDRLITSTCLLNGLTRLRTLHDLLHDFLLHSLCAHPNDVILEKALADVLKYVDAYGIFQQSLMAMKAAQQAACLKMRKHMISGEAADDQQLSRYEVATKKMNRELSKLIKMCCLESGNDTLYDETDEMGGIIRDVCDVTAMVSTSLFTGLISSKSVGGKWKRLVPWIGEERKKINHSGMGTIIIGEFKSGESSSLDKMVEVMDRIETCSDSVFRGLINTRVSLLNLLTQ